MYKKLIPILLFLTFLVTPYGLLAQEASDALELPEGCNDVSPRRCLQLIFKATGTEAQRLEKDWPSLKTDAADHAQDLLSGLFTLGGTGSVNDFLQAIVIGLGIPGLEEAEGLLSFTYNTPPMSSIQLSFSAVENKPELFSKLKAAIPEQGRVDKVATLEGELGRFDDIEVDFKMVFLGADGQFSRNLVDHDSAFGTRVIKAFNEINAEAIKKQSEDFLVINNLPSTPMGQISTTEKRQEARRAIVNALGSIAASDKSLRDFVRTSGYNRAAELAANQPQLYFSGDFHDLDELAGPDSWSGNLVWELPLGANINSMRRLCGSKPTDTDFLTCYTGYIQDPATVSSLQRKWRFRFEGGYGETDEYGPTIGGIDLSLDKVESLSTTVSFGGILRWDIDDTGKKIEHNSFALEASFEDVSNDAARGDRLVATATFTQRVNDDFGFEISAVWASKPEYRGDVDHEVSALAGLRYKINRRQE
jgi:hypothetical protein